MGRPLDESDLIGRAKRRPWLLQIVANEARNRRRSAGRRAHLALRAVTEQPSGDAAPSPEASLLSAEARGTLLAAVNELPEDQRTVIALRFFVGLSEARGRRGAEPARGNGEVANRARPRAAEGVL